MIEPSKMRAAEREVTRIVDELGKPIDPHIRPTITVLRAAGFPTSASCQGHPIGTHGSPYPWVHIDRDCRRLHDHLRHFYRDQLGRYDAILVCRLAHRGGGFWLESVGRPCSDDAGRAPQRSRKRTHATSPRWSTSPPFCEPPPGAERYEAREGSEGSSSGCDVRLRGEGVRVHELLNDLLRKDACHVSKMWPRLRALD